MSLHQQLKQPFYYTPHTTTSPEQMSRRPLSLPINLAIIMLVLLVLIVVFFVIAPLSTGTTYTTLLVLGLVFLGLVIVGVVIYLTLSIKAINLNRRQSNFIDSVTHELKSPIASLKLYLQTLSRRPVSAEEQAEFYRFMLDDVERLDLLINHIPLRREGWKRDRSIPPSASIWPSCCRAALARSAKGTAFPRPWYRRVWPHVPYSEIESTSA